MICGEERSKTYLWNGRILTKGAAVFCFIYHSQDMSQVARSAEEWGFRRKSPSIPILSYPGSGICGLEEIYIMQGFRPNYECGYGKRRGLLPVWLRSGYRQRLAIHLDGSNLADRRAVRKSPCGTRNHVVSKTYRAGHIPIPSPLRCVGSRGTTRSKRTYGCSI